MPALPTRARASATGARCPNRSTVACAVAVAVTALAVAGCGGGARHSASGANASAVAGGTAPSCLPATLDHSAALAGTSVAVSPAPGTVTANPRTQISFQGMPAADIHAISVVGSSSGRHSGRLQGYSQGDGGSFLATTPFTPGEHVLVRAVIGAKSVDFGFRVDTPYSIAAIPSFKNLPAAPADYQSFDTLPGVQAPLLTVTAADRDPGAGDIFVTNGPGAGPYGSLIYTPQGRLVWTHQLSGGDAVENLSVQPYQGERDLTLWQGRVLDLGFGLGEDVVMNSHYQTVATVRGGNGLQADLHDFQITPHGTAYITAYNLIRCDISSAGGPRNGVIVDTAVQDIDMQTGLVRWEWHSLDHVAVNESETSPPTSTPWDWFHLNSIDPQPDGNVFVSARSTWASYQIQGGRGTILWRLGGLKSSFEMGPGTQTAWQHDGRILPDGDVTLFDDGSNPAVHSQSRAVRIALDFGTHTAALRAVYTHAGPPLLAASQGNAQTLASGATVVGWGGVPAISEYAPNGSLLFDAHLSFDLIFYRGFRFPLERNAPDPARGAGQPEQHRRGDDRGHELERRHRRGFLAGAGRQSSRLARSAGDDRGERLRDLHDPAAEIRLRGGAGARLRRSGARDFGPRRGEDVCGLASEELDVRVIAPISSRGPSRPASSRLDACSW